MEKFYRSSIRKIDSERERELDASSGSASNNSNGSSNSNNNYNSWLSNGFYFKAIFRSYPFPFSARSIREVILELFGRQNFQSSISESCLQFVQATNCERLFLLHLLLLLNLLLLLLMNNNGC